MMSVPGDAASKYVCNRDPIRRYNMMRVYPRDIDYLQKVLEAPTLLFFGSTLLFTRVCTADFLGGFLHAVSSGDGSFALLV